jgi:hypothetical protein
LSTKRPVGPSAPAIAVATTTRALRPGRLLTGSRAGTLDFPGEPPHPDRMGAVRPIPRLGGVLQDARGGGRALRVSWHPEDDLVVLSLWDGPRCTGTVRLAAADVPALVEALQIGLPPEPLPIATPAAPALAPPGQPPGQPPDRPPDLLEN